MSGTVMTPPLEPSTPLDGGLRKRVCRACDRCQLKKSKCDGASPCNRCKADNAICVFGDRKKSSQDKVYLRGYVEMLESEQAQLVAGLQEIYKRLQNGQGWTGSPLKETSQGSPFTHDILEGLGVLKLIKTQIAVFREDLTVSQQRLIEDGAGSMQGQPCHGSHSDSAPSPIYESIGQRPNYADLFNLNRFPPTPPNQSPFLRNAQVTPPPGYHTFTHVTNNHSNLWWNTSAPEFDDGMDILDQFESPIVDLIMDLYPYPPTKFQEQIIPPAINPSLTMKDWAGQGDLQPYFNPTMI